MELLVVDSGKYRSIKLLQGGCFFLTAFAGLSIGTARAPGILQLLHKAHWANFSLGIILSSLAIAAILEFLKRKQLNLGYITLASDCLILNSERSLSKTISLSDVKAIRVELNCTKSNFELAAEELGKNFIIINSTLTVEVDFVDEASVVHLLNLIEHWQKNSRSPIFETKFRLR